MENKVNKKTKLGTVVSIAGNKTIVVLSERKVIHPVVKKYVKVHKKFMAHDEDNKCQTGDQVEIIESRPLSARKRWRLNKIINQVNA